MSKEKRDRTSIYNIYYGLVHGLSNFSSTSRAALIYAETADSPIQIYDPQNLLTGHELKLKKIFLESDEWKKKGGLLKKISGTEVIYEENLQLSGLISFGGRSSSIFYQMWFTEHHPDICSVRPTEYWLKEAVWLLSMEFATDNIYKDTFGTLLKEYTTSAITNYFFDKISNEFGSQLNIKKILDSIIEISKTPEEGAWPRGELVFIEPDSDTSDYFICFPEIEKPFLHDYKHARKLLQSVERSNRKLISDGENILGISRERVFKNCISACFYGDYGFLKFNNKKICSFCDGRFFSSNRKAKLVEVEEAFFDSIDDNKRCQELFQIVSDLVNSAIREKHGCTLAIELYKGNNDNIQGQIFEKPIDLKNNYNLKFAKSLTKVDGALCIGVDLKLYGFACLLDGLSIPVENRARGARFNSALRYTALHPNVIVVVVSSDRPVSIIQTGFELNAACKWKSVSKKNSIPESLEGLISIRGI